MKLECRLAFVARRANWSLKQKSCSMMMSLACLLVAQQDTRERTAPLWQLAARLLHCDLHPMSLDLILSLSTPTWLTGITVTTRRSINTRLAYNHHHHLDADHLVTDTPGVPAAPI